MTEHGAYASAAGDRYEGEWRFDENGRRAWVGTSAACGFE